MVVVLNYQEITKIFTRKFIKEHIEKDNRKREEGKRRKDSYFLEYNFATVKMADESDCTNEMFE